MQTTLGNEEVPAYSPNEGDQAPADYGYSIQRVTRHSGIPEYCLRGLLYRCYVQYCNKKKRLFQTRSLPKIKRRTLEQRRRLYYRQRAA